MEKEKLQKLIEDGKSLNKISKETGKSLTTIRYWKDKYNLKSKFLNFKEVNKEEYGSERFCPMCEEFVATSEFYQRRGKNNSSSYCKDCTKNQTRSRMNNLKSLMI